MDIIDIRAWFTVVMIITFVSIVVFLDHSLDC